MAVAALAGVPEFSDVPKVSDELGESVRAAFQEFLLE